MIKKILICTVCIVGVVVVILGYGYQSATQLPDNTPKAFLASGKKAEKVVVCIGDSITHGRVSHNYVDELQARFQGQDVFFVNAGINSELAYNVLQRIDEVVKCSPDFITILIGTNDVSATLNEKNAARYVREQNLPRIPDPKWYEKNLIAIIDILRTKTRAQIGLLSLPPITEDRRHPGFARTREYSKIIKDLAAQHNLVYLPLNEKMNAVLQTRDPQMKSSYVAGEYKLMYKAIFSHYILGRTWDEIAENNDFVFLTDNLHLNGRGALTVAGLIEGFLGGYNDLSAKTTGALE
ncbi:MAG: SGNH/GDSL hydrolase family protein [Desulfobacter sp.]|nr:MAG: SGNH/GDSL hydrolase family protein [Desulfobacter sp.]